MIDKKRTSKKEVILSTAKLLFSRKGFDATSMDEIANQTGVPKSLIYYHFKNKEELLNAIIERFYSEYEDLLKVNSFKDGKEKIANYFDFLYENSDFVRIIIVESLKKDKTTIPTFSVIHRLLQYESEITGNTNLIDYKKSHSRLVAEFFMNIIPCALFACLVDEWSKYVQLDVDTIKNDFYIIYGKTHGAFHDSLDDQR